MYTVWQASIVPGSKGDVVITSDNPSVCRLMQLLTCDCVAVAAFFSILHSWFNAFAEMLRFADRLFYKVCFLSVLLLFSTVNQ